MALSRQEQMIVYENTARVQKNSSAYNSRTNGGVKTTTDKMLKVFSKLNPGTGDGIIVYPEMPVRLLNKMPLAHRFHAENDVDRELLNKNPLNRRVLPYIIEIGGREMGTVRELTTAIQFGALECSQGDCFEVKDNLFVRFSHFDGKTGKRNWRIHNGDCPENSKLRELLFNLDIKIIIS